MRLPQLTFIIIAIALQGCSVLEKTSQHEFSSGHYRLKSAGSDREKVYLEVSSEAIAVHPIQGSSVLPSTERISLAESDSLCHYPYRFSKSSLDIDITTIPIKLRPATSGIPMQVDAGFNAAFYAGWRHDTYHVRSRQSPLGTCSYSLVNRGFDFGVFGGLGSSPIGPFTTAQVVQTEYNGLILQYGLAGFLESSVASFGLACGVDNLMSPDKDQWIYQHKPWLGFIIGFPLN